jgi:hypothetical protein
LLRVVACWLLHSYHHYFDSIVTDLGSKRYQRYCSFHISFEEPGRFTLFIVLYVCSKPYWCAPAWYRYLRLEYQTIDDQDSKSHVLVARLGDTVRECECVGQLEFPLLENKPR